MDIDCVQKPMAVTTFQGLGGGGYITLHEPHSLRFGRCLRVNGIYMSVHW